MRDIELIIAAMETLPQLHARMVQEEHVPLLVQLIKMQEPFILMTYPICILHNLNGHTIE